MSTRPNPFRGDGRLLTDIAVLGIGTAIVLCWLALILGAALRIFLWVTGV